MKLIREGIIYRSLPEFKMSIYLSEASIPFKHDYNFLKDRRFKIDFAILAPKIAIEIEGITPKGGRHQSFMGYMRDCEKYNLLTLEGWRLFRIPSIWLSNQTYWENIEKIIYYISSFIMDKCLA